MSTNTKVQLPTSQELHDREHDQCRFEQGIATKLRNAGRAERLVLYSELYAEYRKAFPESMPDGPGQSDIKAGELAFARRFVTADSVVAEIGPGRCHLAIALAAHCRQMYVIDVVDMSGPGPKASNFKHILTDGIHVSLPDRSVDVVISDQLMEHLHPDDALDQLHELLRILRPGGCYICVTPNRLHGPHDSSARYDDLPCPIVDRNYVANGLHLKEYTNAELSALFRGAGFQTCRHFAGAKGRYVSVPAGLMTLAERCLRLLPPQLRMRSRVLQVLLGVRIVAYKSQSAG